MFDFNKLATFLTVVRERSFSKASIKLQISQPAVTQQIKYIEDYLDAKIIDRKKNGLILTKEGEQLLLIATKFERAMVGAEKELTKLINKELRLSFGASIVIGNYILPKILTNLKSSFSNEIGVSIGLSREILDKLYDKKVDIALIESPIFDDDITYYPWIDDEILIFSNQHIPKVLSAEDLLSYDWVCRNRDSHTRNLFRESLESVSMPDCDSFRMLSDSTSSTAIVQTVLHSSKNGAPVASIASIFALETFIDSKLLFEGRLPNLKMMRKFYIAHLKERKDDPLITAVVGYLLSNSKIANTSKTISTGFANLY